MWKIVGLTSLLAVAAILTDLTSAAAPATTASPGDAVLKMAKEQISNLEQIVDSMAHQLMQQQTFVEERIRSEGMSGIKALRHTHEGTLPEFGDTHIGYNALNLGDRVNTDRKLGIGIP
ncbi:hypothetical protein PoB_006907300 [Plakobranchus ocellatus]|uniref:Uncharacterized protein n=1 Tax=Plakobranchus ocellatus TaxID=259542 RepID=A0AAV4DEB8_9GAST|nr:hypothetical protein PoB_006907300 [Plakobranchus ocellatus]